MTESKDVLRLLESEEGPMLEFKESKILSDSFKLAKIFTSFANTNGGTLLIGVTDEKEIEGMKANKGHEEHIMNIASDKCDPRLVPSFKTVTIPEKGDVYVIDVLERQGPFHAVKTKDGYKFFIRVGSTIRELSPSELSSGERGVEIRARSKFEQFRSKIGKRILYKIYGKLDINVLKVRLALVIIGSLLSICPVLAMFRIKSGTITSVTTYPTWAYCLIALSLFSSILVFDFVSEFPRTRCPNCESYFSFHKKRKWVFEKRTIDERLEEWTTRTLKHCDQCNYEVLGKLQYERHRI